MPEWVIGKSINKGREENKCTEKLVQKNFMIIPGSRCLE